MDYAIELLSSDAEAARELTIGKSHQMVELDVLRDEYPDLFRTTMDALRQACRGVANGERAATNDGRPLDEESQHQFRKAVAELSTLLATK